MIPTIPTVMNTIYDAADGCITVLSAKPEKVLESIGAKERAAHRS